MTDRDAETPMYKTLQWGYGPGLLHCQLCGALVLPEPDALVDRHAAWHTDQEGRP